LPSLAERIIEAIKKPLTIDGMGFFPTASIGLAMGYGSADSADDLMKNADTAMYEVKQKGRDSWHIFNKKIGENTRFYFKMTNGLKEAVKKNQLETYYQPIVDVRTRKIIGAEALLRWKFEGEYISPATFIPICEMTGSIFSIGAWVFEDACRQQVIWQKRYGSDTPYMSINLSARQIVKQELVGDIKNLINETGANPHKMVLEITETTLMSDIETSQRVLAELGAMGFKLAIDDFGTGHSSLSRIKSLPVKIIKVDKVFVDEIGIDESSSAIVAAVIGMAHGIGLTVTAEGVEEQAQFAELAALNCDYVQGYLFSKPLAEAGFIQLMDEHRNGFDMDGSLEHLSA